jgi:hypothetical protein
MSKRTAVKIRAKRRKFLKSVIKNLTSQDNTAESFRKLEYYSKQLKRL